MHSLFLQHIPRKTTHKSQKAGVALLSELLGLIQEKRAAWSINRKYRSLNDKKLSKIVRKRMIAHTKETEAAVLWNGSLKSFYKFIESKLSSEPCRFL